MASGDSPKAPNMSKSISDYLYPFKPKLKTSAQKHLSKSFIAELYRNRSDRSEEPGIYQKLTDWFSLLPHDTLIKVTTQKHPIIVSLLQELFIHNTQQGQHVYSITPTQQKKIPDLTMKSLFLPEKKKLEDLESPKHELEKQIEKSLRLCDSDGYCDSLAIDPELSAREILARLRAVTEEKAFLVPCRASWDSVNNVWSWDYPHWFTIGNYYSIASIASAIIERGIWMHYWNSHDLDPRAPNESIMYKKEPENSISELLEIVRFFRSIDNTTQKKIIGDNNSHNALAEKICNEIEIFSNIRFPGFNCEPPSILIVLSKNVSDMVEISRMFNQKSDRDFIEYLYFSPFERVSRRVDVVARLVLINIIAAASDKKAEDLIKEAKEAASIEKLAAQNKKKQKRKNRNKKKKNESKAELFKDIASDVVNNIISELEDRPEFCVKTSPRALCLTIDPCIKPLIDSPQAKPKVQMPITPTQNNSKQYKPCYYKTPFKRSYKRPHSSKTTKSAVTSTQSTPKCHNAISAQVTPTKTESSTSKFKWNNVPQPRLSSTLDTHEFPPLAAPVPPPLSALHSEIQRFCNTTSKKVKEKYQAFLPNLQEIFQLISKHHPDARIFIYGSYGTELALETSDLDLVVNLLTLPSRTAVQEYCVKLCNELLQSFKFVTGCQAITTARIPVVKVETELYSIDISFGDEDQSHQGVSTMEITHAYITACPSLREIILVLKQLLHCHGLNSSFLGGLNSYSLFIWIVGYFNTLEYPETDLGHLLTGFLEYYGEKFDFITMGIDILNQGSSYPLLRPSYDSIVTIDPLTRANLTSNLYQVKQIKELFSSSYQKILEQLGKPGSKSILKQIFNNFT